MTDLTASANQRPLSSQPPRARATVSAERGRRCCRDLHITGGCYVFRVLLRDPRRAGLLMSVWFLLCLVTGPVVELGVAGAHQWSPGEAVGYVVTAFFAWRVTRGGRISRMLLIIATWIAFLVTGSGIAGQFRLATFGMLAIYAVQFALLVSPAVYLRTRAPGQAEPTASRRVRPSLTLLLLSVLAGLVLTLLSLSSVSFPLAVPGCDHGAAPVALCATVAEGSPLRWLTVYHGGVVVNHGALIKDWVRFALISVSLLYAFWLASRAREKMRGNPFLTAAVGCALGGLALTALTDGIPWRWLSASQYVPQPSGWALLADTAIWTFAGLSGCLLVLGAARLRRPRGSARP
jgi:hypothetical protein